ncbi:hypothetical protein GALMADRAFT_73198 [Galerina marginata CBS 339.88]|uniref:NACHT domain-containing protein n=1 Tax=Galerina marginata (strain CBS 339.88) TaxID=685588 RepID=A0A067SZC2_GALM3|nr:hypothetical protein GALMADRAFT_73198 [Galerina marginata CBS 339.88]
MFEGAHDFIIQGGRFTVEQNGRTGLQLLHQKMTHGATHDSAERYPPPRCHPDTRKAIVGEITDWIDDRSRTSSVVWINGPAGAGKTAIAQTICENCKKSGQLAGSFFFSRTVHGRNNPRYLFATIAYQLAIAIPEVGDRIENAITNDPSIIDKSMELQLQRLIMEPLQALDLSVRPTVIVIDGLDECEGENMQCHILQLLGSVFDHGIIPICFIVGSRPEPWIRDEFNSGLLHRNTRRISLEQSEEANEDIRTFFLAGFSDIHNSPKYRQTMEGVSKPWPSDDVINDLVERASGQFIYPSTVLKFVGDPNYRPADRLEMVLSIPIVKGRKSNPLAELDRLYSQILSTCPEISYTLTVLGSIVAMRDTGAKLHLEWSPRIDSLKIIEKLVGLHPGDAYLALRTIHSLVKVSDLDSSSDGLAPDELRGCIDSEDAVIFYHKSFVDFLLDDTRSGDYSVDFKSINASLAFGCMNIMKTLSMIPATRINYSKP